MTSLRVSFFLDLAQLRFTSGASDGCELRAGEASRERIGGGHYKSPEAQGENFLAGYVMTRYYWKQNLYQIAFL